MAALKLFFFLCVAVYCNYAELQQSHVHLEDAKSDAIALLETLEGTLRQEISLARQQIKGYLEILENTATAVIADAQDTCQEAIKPFLEAIKELQNQATQAAVDITECIGSSVDDISALPGKLVDQIGYCVDRRLLEAKEYVNETLADFNSMYDIITDLGVQIDVCGNKSSAEQIECFKEISDDIEDKIHTLPLKIVRELTTTQAYVYTAVPQMAMCDVGMLDDIQEEGDIIVANVTVCVLEKINGTTVELFDILD